MAQRIPTVASSFADRPDDDSRLACGKRRVTPPGG